MTANLTTPISIDTAFYLFFLKVRDTISESQKQVSKSYEKLKCIIRKKVEILKDELPLIARLILLLLLFVFMLIFTLQQHVKLHYQILKLNIHKFF